MSMPPTESSPAAYATASGVPTPNFRSVKELLGGRFAIDDYQREYKWGLEQMGELLGDLRGKFFHSYKDGDATSAARRYDGYFLGSIIVHKRDGKAILIDGQQRVTSLTLLLIYLYHAAKEHGHKNACNEIAPLIYSAPYGEPEFNLDIPERRNVIKALYSDEGKNFPSDSGDESEKNIINCYNSIAEYGFADTFGNALPHFIYWLIQKVGLIEISTAGDDDAYTIFETMNDRGKSLSHVDMLKALLLARIPDEQRGQCNQIWKKHIGELMDIGAKLDEKQADSKGIKAWLRAQYADSIREHKTGAGDEDWEWIGNRFHRWVRDNRKITVDASGGAAPFILTHFAFFADAHKRTLDACGEYKKGWEPVHYNYHNKFTWQQTVVLAPLSVGDDEDTVRRKIAMTAAFLDIWVMRRAVNHIRVASVSDRMFQLCRSIRRRPLQNLAEELQRQLADENDPSFEGSKDRERHGIRGLCLNQLSRRYIYYLLARVAAFIRKGSGEHDNFADLTNRDIKNACDIEHIWSSNFHWQNNGFGSEDDFKSYRDHVGGLLLLPADVNRSLRDKPFKEKVAKYREQNAWAATLAKGFYDNKPGFAQFCNKYGLSFSGYDEFGTEEHNKRTELLLQLANLIWSPERLRDWLPDNLK